MERYIDAEAAIEHIVDITNGEATNFSAQWIIGFLEAFPTGYSEKRARWIKRYTNRNDEFGEIVKEYLCTSCLRENYMETNYCPCCGAKMDLEKTIDACKKLLRDEREEVKQ